MNSSPSQLQIAKYLGKWNFERIIPTKISSSWGKKISKCKEIFNIFKYNLNELSNFYPKSHDLRESPSLEISVSNKRYEDVNK